MQEINLEARKRDGSGKSVTRKMRAAGDVPAILYGLDKDPMMLGVNSKELHHMLHTASSENILIDLKVGTLRPEKVLLKEVQHHPVTHKVVHVDFQRIDLTKKIVVPVPVHLVGTAEGVRGGGVQEFVMRELEVECLPTDIPNHIEVDVTALKIGDSIHVSDIKVEKFEIVTDPSRTIVIISAPTVVAAPTPAEGAEGEAVAAEAEPAEPEVITEKKREEKEKEKEEKEKK